MNDLKATGDCYQAAGNFIFKCFGDPDFKLVHGMVDGQGKTKGLRFGHAWIEYKERKVIDVANGTQNEYPIELYYGIGNIKKEECLYYTAEQAVKFMVGESHWGPWEKEFKTIKL